MGTQSDHFKKGVTPPELERFREIFRQMPEMSHENRGKAVKPNYPDLSAAALEDYSRMTMNSTQTTWDLYMKGKLSLGTLSELIAWKNGDQDFMAKETVDKKLTVGEIRKVKRIKKEQECGYAEAIAKATGEMPRYQPREHKPRSFDTLLDDIAKASTKWRALMSMAFEMIDEEEAKAGVHVMLFQKAYTLRHIIKENYDFANSRVNRFFNFIKKKLKEGSELSSDAVMNSEMEMEGELDGNRAGTGEEGLGRKEGAPHEDGSSVQDQPR